MKKTTRLSKVNRNNKLKFSLCIIWNENSFITANCIRIFWCKYFRDETFRHSMKCFNSMDSFLNQIIKGANRNMWKKVIHLCLSARAQLFFLFSPR